MTESSDDFTQVDPETVSPPTLVAKPAASAPVPVVAGSQVGRSTQGSAASATSPLGALTLIEIRRTRTFGLVSFVVALGFGVAVPFLPPDSVLTPLMYVAVAVVSAAMLYLVYRARRPETYREGPALTIAFYTPIVGIAIAIPYAGPFSPIIGVGILGIYVIGMGSKLALAAAVYGSTALIHAITGVIVI